MPNSLKKHDAFVQKNGFTKHDFAVVVNGELVRCNAYAGAAIGAEPREVMAGQGYAATKDYAPGGGK